MNQGTQTQEAMVDINKLARLDHVARQLISAIDQVRVSVHGVSTDGFQTPTFEAGMTGQENLGGRRKRNRKRNRGWETRGGGSQRQQGRGPGMQVPFTPNLDLSTLGLGGIGVGGVHPALLAQIVQAQQILAQQQYAGGGYGGVGNGGGRQGKRYQRIARNFPNAFQP